MPNRWLVWTLAPLVLIGIGTPADGQGVTTQGMFGSRTLGGVGGGNPTFGGAGSSFGGGSFGRGGMGSGGMGSGLGSQMGSGGGLLGGNERFVRGNRQAGQFVGSDTQDATSFLQGVGGRAGTQGQASRSGLNPQSNNRANQANRSTGRGRGGRGAAEEVRVSISTGFVQPRPAALQVSSSLSTLFERSTQIGKLSPIRVVFEGETAILRGAVETAHDRALAEQLTRLEPGVRDVKNELTVGPARDPATAAP